MRSPVRHLPLVGAVLYALWGVLHLVLGVSMSWSALASGVPRTEQEAESAMFFLFATVFGAQAITVALTMNRVNDRLGYWLNLTVLGAVDTAFVVVMVLPGHVDAVGGLSGPVLWCLAAAVSTVAVCTCPVTTPTQSPRPGPSAAHASCGTRRAGS